MQTWKMKAIVKKHLQAGAVHAFLLLGCLAWAQAQTSVAGNPLFQSFTRANGDFTLTGSTRIIVDSGETELVRLLSARRGWLGKLRHATGLDIQITTGVAATNADIVLTKATTDSDFAAAISNTPLKFTSTGRTKNIGSNVSSEGYKYKAGASGVQLQYNETLGGLRALQAITRLLMQSSEGLGAHRTLPNGTGLDYPIFSKRIAMLDVGRFFVPADNIIGFLEKMSFHKMNVLQMHLNDDTRIGNGGNAALFSRLKGWPTTTSYGFFRLEPLTIPGYETFDLSDTNQVTRDGNFYTRAEWERIEDAAERYGVEIVPEFNAPGHSLSWRDAIPDGPDGRPVLAWGKENPTGTANYVAAIMNAYSDWFRSKAIHFGAEEHGWTHDEDDDGIRALSTYFRTIIDATKHHPTRNPDGYKRFQAWSEGINTNNYPAEIEWVAWKGHGELRGLNSGDVVHEINLNEGYFVPYSAVGNDRWISPTRLFNFYYGNGDGGRRKSSSYGQVIPEGLGIAFWGDKLLQLSPQLGNGYILGGMNHGLVANSVVTWHSWFQPNSGRAVTLTAYADTGYDRLVSASQETHSHWVMDRFPYLSTGQASVILYTTTSHPTFVRVGDRAGIPYALDGSGNYTKYEVDKAVRDRFVNGTERMVLDNINTRYDLEPGDRATDWMFWDEWELIKMFKGPNQFSSGMYDVQLVGEGNALSSGRICTDIGVAEAAIDEFARTVSVCDEDSWFNDISGTGGLRKSGPGTLNLHGENSFQGDVMLAGGELVISYGESLGLGSGSVTFAGGTLVASPSYQELVPYKFINQGVRNPTEADKSRIPTEYSSRIYWGYDYSKFKKVTVATPSITIAAGRGLVMAAAAGDIRIDNTYTEVRGVVSGAGMLRKTGAGKLALKGTNTFSGGLMLAAGQLEIGADSNLGATAGTVTFAGGTLSFSGNAALPASRPLAFSSEGTIDTNGNDASVLGVISGSGGLMKRGAGILSLGGANAYGGDTRVAAGVLSGAADSFRGDIYTTAAGTVVFAQSSDGGYGGDLFGSGLIRKAGDGTLTLTGEGEVDWEVMAGTVENEAFLSGNIEFSGSGERVFNFRNNQRYVKVISGDGKVVKSNGGWLLLIGNSRRFSGEFDVVGGSTLLVDNRLGGNVNVGAGSELGGRGRIGGAVSVAVGGLLSPSRGQDGRLIIDGDLDLAGDLKVTFGLGGLVAGTADIASSSLMVLDTFPPLDGDVRQKFNVLIAAGGVTGRFAGADTTALPFMTLTITYGSDRVQIRAGRNDRDLADLLETPDEEIEFPVDEPDEPDEPEVLPPPDVEPVVEQPAAPIRLDGNNIRALAHLVTELENSDNPAIEPLSNVFMTLPADSPDGRSISERIEEILDSFVAKTHASAKAVFMANSAGLRNQAIGQTRAGLDAVGSAAAQRERFNLASKQWGLDGGQEKASALWVKITGSKGQHSKGELQDEDMEFKGAGFLIGGDRAVAENVRVGLFGGISSTEFSQERSEGEDESQNIGLYAGISREKLGLRVGATFSRHDIVIDRTVAGTTITLAADYGSQTYDIFAELGYLTKKNRALLEPFVGISYTWHTAGEYTEADASNLTMSMYPKQSTDTSIFEVGLRFRVEVPQLPARTRLHGMLAWHLPVKDPEIFVTQRIGNTSQPVDVPGTPISGNGFTLEAGLADLALGEDTDFDLIYRYSKSFYYEDSSEKHSFSGSFSYSF